MQVPVVPQQQPAQEDQLTAIEQLLATEEADAAQAAARKSKKQKQKAKKQRQQEQQQHAEQQQLEQQRQQQQQQQAQRSVQQHERVQSQPQATADARPSTDAAADRQGAALGLLCPAEASPGNAAQLMQQPDDAQVPNGSASFLQDLFRCPLTKVTAWLQYIGMLLLLAELRLF